MTRSVCPALAVIALALSFTPANAADAVYIDVVPTGQPTPVDTLYNGYDYEFRIWIENSTYLRGIGLGFRIFGGMIRDGASGSERGMFWSWRDVPGGYGPTGKACVTVRPGSRMYPPEAVWDDNEFQVWPFDMDENTPDTIGISGFGYVRGGLPTGPVQHMMSIHFTAHVPWGGLVTLRIDSTYCPGGGPFEFFDPWGGTIVPMYFSESPWPARYTCCIGDVGNVNRSAEEDADIGDMQALIDHLFINMGALPCPKEADVDYSGYPFPVDEDVDIGDMQLLIDHLFIDMDPLGSCFPRSDAYGTLTDMTGCKSMAVGETRADTPSDEDCMEYQYDGEGFLSIRHINAGFNCCPEIAPEISIEGNVITIDEIEIEGLCDCLCLFDLDYEINNLPPGVYTIHVIEPYVVEGEEPLIFIANLTSPASGQHCVDRHYYPWGY